MSKGYRFFYGDTCLDSLNDPYLVVTLKLLRKQSIDYPSIDNFSYKLCKHYNLSMPLILVVNRLTKVYGWFYPEDSGIVLTSLGQNVCTLLHELAHYVAYKLDGSARHDVQFAKRFKEVYEFWEKNS